MRKKPVVRVTMPTGFFINYDIVEFQIELFINLCDKHFSGTL